MNNLPNELVDLSSPISDGYKSTWGDKKEFCELEAKLAYQAGVSIAKNPYFEDTWPHYWWNEEFLLHFTDNQFH